MVKQVACLIIRIDFSLELYLTFYSYYMRIFLLFHLQGVLHKVGTLLICVSFGWATPTKLRSSRDEMEVTFS
jgi:hypothetical protein